MVWGLALLLGACAPSDDELCVHISTVTGKLSDEGLPKKRFFNRCTRSVKGRRLDAGALRWGGVAKCVKAAQDQEAIDACWVGQKPPDP